MLQDLLLLLLLAFNQLPNYSFIGPHKTFNCRPFFVCFCSKIKKKKNKRINSIQPHSYRQSMNNVWYHIAVIIYFRAIGFIACSCFSLDSSDFHSLLFCEHRASIRQTLTHTQNVQQGN